jgi:hypothetical protein
MGVEIKGSVSITPATHSTNLNYLTPLKFRAKLFTTPLLGDTPMIHLRIFPSANYADADFHAFVRLNHPWGSSLQRSGRIEIKLPTDDYIVWAVLGDHRSVENLVARRLRGAGPVLLTHVADHVDPELVGELCGYLAAYARPTQRRSFVPADLVIMDPAVLPTRVPSGASQCLICGGVDTHLGLPCPKMSPTAHWSEGV